MKRTIIALAVFMAVAASAGLVLAGSVTAPWFNETSGWSTFIIVTADKTSNTSTNTFTVTFYSSTGSAVASTSYSLTSTSAPWVHSASEFITAGTSTSFGSIEFTEGGTSFDDLNIIVDVEKDSTGAGFILPLYSNATGNADKFGTW